MVVPGPEGRVEMGSDFRHDLLGVARRRPPAAFAAGLASSTPGGRGIGDDHLMPGDLLIDRDDHGPRRGWRRRRSVALPWCRWAAAPRSFSSNHGQSLEASMAEPTAVDEDHQIALPKRVGGAARSWNRLPGSGLCRVRLAAPAGTCLLIALVGSPQDDTRVVRRVGHGRSGGRPPGRARRGPPTPGGAHPRRPGRSEHPSGAVGEPEVRRRDGREGCPAPGLRVQM
jgi:hypothetical protein